MHGEEPARGSATMCVQSIHGDIYGGDASGLTTHLPAVCCGLGNQPEELLRRGSSESRDYVSLAIHMRAREFSQGPRTS